MRLLVLSLTLPVPANNGHRMRIGALLRALAVEGHDITLLTFAEPGELEENDVRGLEMCHFLDVVPRVSPSLSGTSNYGERMVSLFGTVPYGVKRFRSRLMTQRISHWLRSQALDAVLAETSYALVNLPASLSIPLVIDNQNIEHRLLERYVTYERNPARMAYAWQEMLKLRRWEQRAWSSAAMAWVCSPDDGWAVERLSPKTAVAVLPNIVDLEVYASGASPEPLTVLYAGGMDWYPNRDAVEFFVSRILPELRRRAPGVRFVVAGRNPSDGFRRRFADVPDVEFTGTVPDMRAEIARAAVCVVPLRIGSGTRLKILEAAAMAKPVVSTRVGAEGLEFVPGKEILLADDPLAFAREVAALLGDPSVCRSLGQAARRRVQENYSFPVLRTALRRALARMEGPSMNCRGRYEVHSRPCEVTS